MDNIIKNNYSLLHKGFYWNKNAPHINYLNVSGGLVSSPWGILVVEMVRELCQKSLCFKSMVKETTSQTKYPRKERNKLVLIKIWLRPAWYDHNYQFDSLPLSFIYVDRIFSTKAREVSLRGRKRLRPNPLTVIYSVN